MYALWRELTAADVAAAERRRTPASRPAAASAADGRPARARGGRGGRRPRTARRRRPTPVALSRVVAAEGRRRSALSVLVASLLEHASRPLHLWVLRAARRRARSSGGSPSASRSSASAGCRSRARGDLARRRARRPGGVAGCCCADLLPGVDRVVAAAAARGRHRRRRRAGRRSTSAATRSPRRPRPAPRDVSGFGVIHAAAARLARPHRGGRGAAPHRARPPRVRLRRVHAPTCSCSTSRACARERLQRRRRCRSSRSSGSTTSRSLHYLVGPDRATRARALGARADAHAGARARADRTGPTTSSRGSARSRRSATRWRRYAARLRPRAGVVGVRARQAAGRRLRRGPRVVPAPSCCHVRRSRSARRRDRSARRAGRAARADARSPSTRLTFSGSAVDRAASRRRSPPARPRR